MQLKAWKGTRLQFYFHFKWGFYRRPSSFRRVVRYFASYYFVETTWRWSFVAIPRNSAKNQNAWKIFLQELSWRTTRPAFRAIIWTFLIIIQLFVKIYWISTKCFHELSLLFFSRIPQISLRLYRLRPLSDTWSWGCGTPPRPPTRRPPPQTLRPTSCLCAPLWTRSYTTGWDSCIRTGLWANRRAGTRLRWSTTFSSLCQRQMRVYSRRRTSAGRPHRPSRGAPCCSRPRPAGHFCLGPCSFFAHTRFCSIRTPLVSTFLDPLFRAYEIGQTCSSRARSGRSRNNPCKPSPIRRNPCGSCREIPPTWSSCPHSAPCGIRTWTQSQCCPDIPWPPPHSWSPQGQPLQISSYTTALRYNFNNNHLNSILRLNMTRCKNRFT